MLSSNRMSLFLGTENALTSIEVQSTKKENIQLYFERVFPCVERNNNT